MTIKSMPMGIVMSPEEDQRTFQVIRQLPDLTVGLVYYALWLTGKPIMLKDGTRGRKINSEWRLGFAGFLRSNFRLSKQKIAELTAGLMTVGSCMHMRFKLGQDSYELHTEPSLLVSTPDRLLLARHFLGKKKLACTMENLYKTLELGCTPLYYSMHGDILVPSFFAHLGLFWSELFSLRLERAEACVRAFAAHGCIEPIIREGVKGYLPLQAPDERLALPDFATRSVPNPESTNQGASMPRPDKRYAATLLIRPPDWNTVSPQLAYTLWWRSLPLGMERSWQAPKNSDQDEPHPLARHLAELCHCTLEEAERVRLELERKTEWLSSDSTTAHHRYRLSKDGEDVLRHVDRVALAREFLDSYPDLTPQAIYDLVTCCCAQRAQPPHQGEMVVQNPEALVRLLFPKVKSDRLIAGCLAALVTDGSFEEVLDEVHGTVLKVVRAPASHLRPILKQPVTVPTVATSPPAKVELVMEPPPAPEPMAAPLPAPEPIAAPIPEPPPPVEALPEPTVTEPETAPAATGSAIELSWAAIAPDIPEVATAPPRDIRVRVLHLTTAEYAVFGDLDLEPWNDTNASSLIRFAYCQPLSNIQAVQRGLVADGLAYRQGDKLFATGNPGDWNLVPIGDVVRRPLKIPLAIKELLQQLWRRYTPYGDGETAVNHLARFIDQHQLLYRELRGDPTKIANVLIGLSRGRFGAFHRTRRGELRLSTEHFYNYELVVEGRNYG